MKNVEIDCYGNRNDREPERFRSILGEKRPHLVDARENVTYIAFDRAEILQPIHKIVVADTITTIWWGYGAWSDRENLNYPNGMQDTITISVED